jgi:hypothetical protein
VLLGKRKSVLPDQLNFFDQSPPTESELAQILYRRVLDINDCRNLFSKPNEITQSTILDAIRKLNQFLQELD